MLTVILWRVYFTMVNAYLKKKNIDFRRQIYKFLNCDYQAGELSQSSLVPIKNWTFENFPNCSFLEKYFKKKHVSFKTIGK